MRYMILFVSFLFLAGCQSTLEINRLAFQYQSALVRHHHIVKDLRNNSIIFSEEEKEFLVRTNGELSRLLQEAYNSRSGAKQVIPILTHYHAIKGHYMAVISLLDGKLHLLPSDVEMRIRQQINDVKWIDKELMSSFEDKGVVDGDLVLQLVSIMGKFALTLL